MPDRKTTLEAGDLVAVTLACLSCRKERVVRIPADRGWKGRISWECFECQRAAGNPHARPEGERTR